MFMEARKRGNLSLIDGTRHLSDQNVHSKQKNGINPAGPTPLHASMVHHLYFFLRTNWLSVFAHIFL